MVSCFMAPKAIDMWLGKALGNFLIHYCPDPTPDQSTQNMRTGQMWEDMEQDPSSGSWTTPQDSFNFSAWGLIRSLWRPLGFQTVAWWLLQQQAVSRTAAAPGRFPGLQCAGVRDTLGGAPTEHFTKFPGRFWNVLEFVKHWSYSVSPEIWGWFLILHAHVILDTFS